MNDKFKIINMIKDIINDYDKLSVNYKLKDNIMEELYNLLRITYISNDTYNKNKKYDLQIEILSNIKYITYLTYKLKLDDRVYKLFLYKLETITKFVRNWIKYTS